MKIELNDQEMNIIGKGLGMLPYVEVSALIDNLRNQIAQTPAPTPSEETP